MQEFYAKCLENSLTQNNISILKNKYINTKNILWTHKISPIYYKKELIYMPQEFFKKHEDYIKEKIFNLNHKIYLKEIIYPIFKFHLIIKSINKKISQTIRDILEILNDYFKGRFPIYKNKIHELLNFDIYKINNEETTHFLLLFYNLHIDSDHSEYLVSIICKATKLDIDILKENVPFGFYDHIICSDCNGKPDKKMICKCANEGFIFKESYTYIDSKLGNMKKDHNRKYKMENDKYFCMIQSFINFDINNRNYNKLSGNEYIYNIINLNNIDLIFRKKIKKSKNIDYESYYFIENIDYGDQKSNFKVTDINKIEKKINSITIHLCGVLYCNNCNEYHENIEISVYKKSENISIKCKNKIKYIKFENESIKYLFDDSNESYIYKKLSGLKRKRENNILLNDNFVPVFKKPK